MSEMMIDNPCNFRNFPNSLKGKAAGTSVFLDFANKTNPLKPHHGGFPQYIPITLW